MTMFPCYSGIIHLSVWIAKNTETKSVGSNLLNTLKYTLQLDTFKQKH